MSGPHKLKITNPDGHYAFTKVELDGVQQSVVGVSIDIGAGGYGNAEGHVRARLTYDWAPVEVELVTEPVRQYVARLYIRDFPGIESVTSGSGETMAAAIHDLADRVTER